MRSIARNLKWMALIALALCMTLVIWAGIAGMRSSIRVASENLAPEATDQVVSYKTMRQQLRAMEKAQLNDVAHDSSADPEIAAMAQRRLLQLYEREEKELMLEGILAMRGFENPVVSVQEDSVNVLVQAQLITQQQSQMILELVCRETGAESGNVKIIPIN